MKCKRKLKAVAYLVVFVILLYGSVVFAQPPDVKGHWAEVEISRWIDNRLVKGYTDGTFGPDKPITRAEFVVLVNRAFGLEQTAKLSFKDIFAANWFYEDICKGAAAGYITGYTDGTFKPNAKISRQEAAAILFRVMKLDIKEDISTLKQFRDEGDIAQWSKGYVNSVVASGYMKGLPDLTFRPVNPITRAETIATLDRAAGRLINKPGNYGSESVETVSGNVTISTADVNLRNTIIKGDLYLAAGIGDGKAALDNVTVLGRTLICGGGPNSIVIRESALGVTIIDTETDDTRVVISNATTISELIIRSGSIIQNEEAGNPVTGSISVNIPEGKEVIFEGNFDRINVESSNVNIKVASGTIRELNILQNAGGTNISLSKEASVTSLNVNAPALINGQGQIHFASINSNGVTMKQTPSSVKLGEGMTAIIGGSEVGSAAALGGGGGSGGGPVEENPSVVSAVSVNGVTVEVAFDKDLKTVKKSDFAFNNNLKVDSASLKQGSQKVVVLTTGAQEVGVVYKLSYKGTDTGKIITGMASLSLRWKENHDPSGTKYQGESCDITFTAELCNGITYLNNIVYSMKWTKEDTASPGHYIDASADDITVMYRGEQVPFINGKCRIGSPHKVKGAETHTVNVIFNRDGRYKLEVFAEADDRH